MKIVVFGAGGFLGEQIVNQLAQADDEIFAVLRPGSELAFDPDRVHRIEGDLEDPDFTRDALAGKDAAIFSAGRTWQPGLDIGEYQRQNVRITRNFFEALESNPCMRAVFTSSMSTIVGSRRPFIFTEDAGRDEVCESRLTPYDLAKIECERIALQAAEKGCNVVILNPALILGPGASVQSKIGNPFFLLWICQGKAPFFINAQLSLCDVRDVAKAHLAALTRGRIGHRYILGGHHRYRAEFYAMLSRLAGIRPPKRVPVSLATTFTALGDGLSAITGGLFRNAAHRRFVRAQGLHYCGASQKAIDELGYTTTDVEKTVLDALHHYLERGLLPNHLAFLEIVTPENAQEVLCLRQLAASHAFKRFLVPKIPLIYEICQSNHALRDALIRITSESTFLVRSGRFRWNRSACREPLRIYRTFFDYLYFASNDFLKSVS